MITLAHAEERYFVLDYWISGTEKDKTLSKEESVFRFTLNNREVSPNTVIDYSIDDKVGKVSIDSTRSFEIVTRPGEHSFEFLLNTDHYEIFVPLMKIDAQFRTSIILTFRKAQQIMQVRKPVIYLYPETTQGIHVELDVKGELEFSYPPYEEGWNVTASPDGPIHWEDKKLNYLFWESSQALATERSDFKNGTLVRRKDLLPFFERTLTQAGFTPQEKQDFITYWYPEMSRHSILYICYKFNEECDIFAELTVTPPPTQVNRVYLFWNVPEAYLPEEEFWPVQKIPSMERNGFTVLEWGGAKME